MKCKFFTIQELVSKEVFNQHKENAFQFFDSKLLETIDFIREGIGRPMIINNYAKGGSYSQRGLRENICQIVKDKTKNNQLYLSAHVLGKAIDFDVSGLTAEQVREWIEKNKEKLPYPIRLEKGVSWVHCDTMNITNNKIVYF